MTQQTASAPFTVLQSFVFPEPALAADLSLYANLTGAAHLEAGGLVLGDGAMARFDTYFNLFDADLWGEATRVQTVGLQLT
ncbi:MAG TPA: hypothetical protein ENK80_05390, partial [Rhodobacterales bacterium]|nr:hypothetical protein [Rhodobacterales bacterium]